MSGSDAIAAGRYFPALAELNSRRVIVEDYTMPERCPAPECGHPLGRAGCPTHGVVAEDRGQWLWGHLTPGPLAPPLFGSSERNGPTLHGDTARDRRMDRGDATTDLFARIRKELGG